MRISKVVRRRNSESFKNIRENFNRRQNEEGREGGEEKKDSAS